MQNSLQWKQPELEESLHYHRQKSVVYFAVKNGLRVLHALPVPAPTAHTNCTNSAKGSRGLVLDTRPNRSGQGVPDVVHATLALTIEDSLFGRCWGGWDNTGKRREGRGLYTATDPATPQYRVLLFVQFVG